MSGINAGILSNAYPLTPPQIAELEQRVLETGETFCYLDENHKVNFMLPIDGGTEIIKDLAWHNAQEFVQINSPTNQAITRTTYTRTDISNINLAKFEFRYSSSPIWTEPNFEKDFDYRVENGCAVITGYTSSSRSVIIPKTLSGYPVSAIEQDVFAYSDITDITILNGLTSIGERAFTDCNDLASIVIPDSVTLIGEAAFRACRSLTSVVLSKNITQIPNEAFSSCVMLSSIDIPIGVTAIGAGAFQGCSNLMSINIPESVSSIGEWAFSECVCLSTISLPASITNIAPGAFNWTGLTSITIPEGITVISENTFTECFGLTSVIIPKSVTSIDYGAFWCCGSLTNILIPDSITFIDSMAFASTGLTSVTIPASVTQIGAEAFAYIRNLSTVVFAGTTAQLQNILANSFMIFADTNVTCVQCVDGNVAI